MVSHLLQVDGVNGIFIAFFSPKSPCGLLVSNLFLLMMKTSDGGREGGREKI